MRPRTAAITVLCAVLVLLGTGVVRAQGTIADGPASFSLNADHFFDTSADLSGVSASLPADHLFGEGWWYRVAGDPAETFLTGPDDQAYEGNVATLGWSDVDGRGFTAVETDTIADAGGPSGRVTLSLTITNLSDVDPLAIDVFHMADIDLAGSLNDSAVAAAPGLIRVSDGAESAEYYASGPSGFLAAPSTGVSVATVLFDDVADEFGDTGLPFGPGDVTAGFQWESNVIPPSGSQTFTAVIAVNTVAVPGTTPISTTTSTSTSGRTTSTTRPPAGVEVCDDCRDNDGDGLIDFEDPDCCPAAERGAIELTRARLKGRGAGGTGVALTATLPPAVLPALPASADLTIQLGRPTGDALLCARIPAATLRQRKSKVIFRDRIGSLERVTILRGKANAGRLVVRSKTVPLALPAPGPVTVTFGLRETSPGAISRCAIGSGEFHPTRKGLTLR